MAPAADLCRMRFLLLLLLLPVTAAPLHAQAVQRKHLVMSLGVGVGLSSMTGPTDTLRMQPTESGVVHFGFDYALGDRWSLGFRFDRTGTDRQVERFDGVRFNNFLVQLTYRPWVARRMALELNGALGGSRLSVDPKNELLPVTATPGVVLCGARFIHLISGTIGAFAALDASVSSEGIARFKDDSLRDAEGTDVRLAWKATRLTAGLLVRF